jgi:MFS family permease
MNTTVRVAAPTATAPFTASYRAWLLCLMMAVNLLNMADRQGLAAVASAIKVDLALSDTQLGLIQGIGFAIFYTLMGLPLARLAESHSRVRIVGSCVAAFGAVVALCGTARNFAGILLCRIGVAVGDAGFGPPVGSLLGDHFPAARRANVMTIIWLGAPLGAVLGAAGAGFIAQNYGWRQWFFVLCIPAFFVAAAILLTLREPPRGLSDERLAGEGPPPSMREVLAFLWTKRSMRYLLVGAAFGTMTLNGIGQFIGRFFVSSLGLSYAQAGRDLGLLSLTSMSIGFALGGFGMSWAARFHRRWFALGPALALMVSVPLLWAGFSRSSPGAALPLLLVGQIAMFMYYTPVQALAQNMVDSRMRASSAFVLALVMGLIGSGLGPTIAGLLSDLYSAAAFPGANFQLSCAHGPAFAVPDLACKQAVGMGVRRALMTMSVFAAVAGVHFALASRSLAQDLDRPYSNPDRTRV